MCHIQDSDPHSKVTLEVKCQKWGHFCDLSLTSFLHGLCNYLAEILIIMKFLFILFITLFFIYFIKQNIFLKLCCFFLRSIITLCKKNKSSLFSQTLTLIDSRPISDQISDPSSPVVHEQALNIKPPGVEWSQRSPWTYKTTNEEESETLKMVNMFRQILVILTRILLTAK